MKTKCETNSEHDTNISQIFNKHSKGMCVFAYFFFVCFRLKSYSQVMRNTEKCMSSHRFGILRHCNLCVCMHVSH